MEERKILNIVIKQKWFDEIKEGIKKEEYREIKPYWEVRLYGKKYTHILFRVGYKKDAANALYEYGGYRIKEVEHEEWKWYPTKVYAIQIGKEITYG